MRLVIGAIGPQGACRNDLHKARLQRQCGDLGVLRGRVTVGNQAELGARLPMVQRRRRVGKQREPRYVLSVGPHEAFEIFGAVAGFGLGQHRAEQLPELPRVECRQHALDTDGHAQGLLGPCRRGTEAANGIVPLRVECVVEIEDQVDGSHRGHLRRRLCICSPAALVICGSRPHPSTLNLIARPNPATVRCLAVRALAS